MEQLVGGVLRHHRWHPASPEIPRYSAVSPTSPRKAAESGRTAESAPTSPRWDGVPAPNIGKRRRRFRWSWTSAFLHVIGSYSAFAHIVPCRRDVVYHRSQDGTGVFSKSDSGRRESPPGSPSRLRRCSRNNAIRWQSSGERWLARRTRGCSAAFHAARLLPASD